MVELLIETRKVDLDATDNNGRSPLSWAAESGGQAVMELLIETGKVDVDLKDNSGRSPLSWGQGNGGAAD
jgi:ankyrin repeat protein